MGPNDNKQALVKIVVRSGLFNSIKTYTLNMCYLTPSEHSFDKNCTLNISEFNILIWYVLCSVRYDRRCPLNIITVTSNVSRDVSIYSTVCVTVYSDWHQENFEGKHLWIFGQCAGARWIFPHKWPAMLEALSWDSVSWWVGLIARCYSQYDWHRPGTKKEGISSNAFMSIYGPFY